jgi:hypothetical protein
MYGMKLKLDKKIGEFYAYAFSYVALVPRGGADVCYIR